MYQVEHNNMEPYEDNHHYREDKVYTNKEALIKDILDQGYKEVYDDFRDKYMYQKGDPEGFGHLDCITIHELTIIEN